MFLVSRTLTAIISFCWGNVILACASCGSGGDDPLILYPWERWKIYTGFSHSANFVPVDVNGKLGGEFGPHTRDTTTVSLGHSFSNRMFATVSAPFIANKRSGDIQRGWGDPMLTARYTIIQQDLTDERIPQVQLIAAVRDGKSTSVYDYRSKAQLDVFGSGVPEWRTGVDVWHGMFEWKAGFAQTVTAPLKERESQIGIVKNGTTFRSTITLGYGWGDRGKILTGINREQTSKKYMNGRPQANSEKLNQGAFLTGDLKIEKLTMLRLTVARSAAFGVNKNTSQNETLTISAMRSF